MRSFVRIHSVHCHYSQQLSVHIKVYCVATGLYTALTDATLYCIVTGVTLYTGTCVQCTPWCALSQVTADVNKEDIDI